MFIFRRSRIAIVIAALPDESVVHRTSDQRVISLHPEFTAIYHRRTIHLDEQQALTVTTTSDTVQLHRNTHTHTHVYTVSQKIPLT